jgi:hypothetical protein
MHHAAKLPEYLQPRVYRNHGDPEVMRRQAPDEQELVPTVFSFSAISYPSFLCDFASMADEAFFPLSELLNQLA